MLLKKKVIIITGAGGGLGEGIAHICHSEGAHVVIADVREKAAKNVAKSLGKNAAAVACDVSLESDLKKLVKQTVAKFGRIDGLVNNAGVNFSKPFLETTQQDWDRVMSIDLKPVYFLTQLVCRQMLAQKNPGGSIVNIASVHSLSCMPCAGPYDAAKWGVVGLSKSIAVELAHQGIRVNVVSPGLLNTQIWKDIIAAAPGYEECMTHWRAQIPLGRVIEPGEIGNIVAFLLSDRSASMTGANILADGGMTAQLISKEPYTPKIMDGK